MLSKLTSGCVAISVCTACVAAVAQVQHGSATDWLDRRTDSRAFEKSQQLPVSVSWTESPLREQLNTFAAQCRRAIFVDRRVDPTVKLTFDFLDRTTEQTVWELAEANGLGVCRVESLLYVGPKDAAARLPFVIEELEKIAKRTQPKKSRWTSGRDEIRWSRATTTEEIQEWMEQLHGFQLDGEIPHDVWPAADWPSLSLIQQMSLLLVGFDLSFEIEGDGKRIRLKKFPAIETAKLRIRLPRDSKLDLKACQRRFADLKLANSGRSLSISGPVESIAALEAWMVEQQTVLGDDVVQRTFDLNTTARRGDILASVAQQTGRKLTLDGAVGDALTQRISISIKKASLETLLDQCLDGTGLGYRLTKSELRIVRNGD
ncbi:STN domain-containing protein [Mariniblastus fucicola]|nr:STN domain-containing protein [Mariniblastus fucicola]